MPTAERLARIRSTARARLIVGAYRGASFVAGHLPARIAERLAGVLGPVLGWTLRGQRAQAQRHQLRLTPGLAEAALAERTRRVFESYARYWVSMFRLQGRSSSEIDGGIDVDGARYIDDALALGNGVIMAMPHIGAWDHGGAWMAQHWPISVVAERVDPPELFDWFCTQRARTGMTVVPLDTSAGSTLLAALRRNEVVGLLCDRDVAGGGVEVEFFGERTTLPAGPATLSLRIGAAILPNAVYQRDGRAHGVIRPPIVFERTGKLRADITALTQLLAHELETLILAAPEQWHVLQPNWPADRP